MSPRPPVERVGPYRILYEIGKGGMGRVVKARHEVLGRHVALKLVAQSGNRSLAERLLREARALAAVPHKNIVEVYDAAEYDGEICVAMQLLEGRNLKELLEQGIGVARGLDIVLEVLCGLSHAHGHGFVHRDVKPANVHCGYDRVVRLVDFGLAKTAAAGPDTVALGTPRYASPEQLDPRLLRGAPLDARTDIFSAGAILREIIVGRPAYGDDAGLCPAGNAWFEQFAPLREIVATSMADDRDRRFASAHAMMVSIQQFMHASGHAVHELDEGLKRGASPPAQAPRPPEGWSTRPTAPIDDDHAPASCAVDPSGYTLSTEEAAAVAGGLAPELLAPPGPTHRPNAGRPIPNGRSLWPLAAAAVLGIGLAAGWLAGSGRDGRGPEEAASVQRPEPPRPFDEIVELRTPAQRQPELGATPRRATPARSTGQSTRSKPASQQPGMIASQPDQDERAAPETLTAVRVPAGGLDLQFGIVRRKDSGAHERLDANFPMVRSGDAIRFNFESSVGGFLYLMHQGTSGKWSVLLSHSEDGANWLESGRPLEFPMHDWIDVRGDPGKERLFVLLSRIPIDDVPSEGPQDPIRTIEAAVIESILSTVRPRDLVLRKERPKASSTSSDPVEAYVATRMAAAKTIMAEIVLNHVQ